MGKFIVTSLYFIWTRNEPILEGFSLCYVYDPGPILFRWRCSILWHNRVFCLLFLCTVGKLRHNARLFWTLDYNGQNPNFPCYTRNYVEPLLDLILEKKFYSRVLWQSSPVGDLHLCLFCLVLVCLLYSIYNRSNYLTLAVEVPQIQNLTRSTDIGLLCFAMTSIPVLQDSHLNLINSLRWLPSH